MPEFVYRCPRCSHTQEIVHGMDDEPEVRCKACEAAPQMVRVLQPVGFLTIGEGFESRGRA